MADGQNRHDLNAPLLATIGVTGAILVVAIIIGIQAWFGYEQQQEWDRKVLSTTNRELQRLYTEQGANLRGGRWVDPDHQWATIRIERAMDLTVKRYAEDRAEAQAEATAAAAEQG